MLQAGAVGQEAGQSGLEEETESEMVIPHALVDDRIATGLADNQICPLHYDDRHEEGGVTRVLQSLPLPIGLKRKRKRDRESSGKIFSKLRGTKCSSTKRTIIAHDWRSLFNVEEDDENGHLTI